MARSENRFSGYLDSDLAEKLEAVPEGKRNEVVNLALRRYFDLEIDGEIQAPGIEGRVRGLEVKTNHMWAMIQALHEIEAGRTREKLRAKTE